MLPGDHAKRIDLITLKKGDLKEAQKLKEMLE